MGRKISSSSSVLLLFLLSWSACSVSSGADTLSPNRPLLDDGVTALVSAGGSFRLGFFSPDGRPTNRYVGIWYNNIPDQTVVWVANRRQPIAAGSGILSLTTDGILILTGEDNSTVIWSSESPASALENPVARILNDGNFVVQEASSIDDDNPNSFAWQSFYFPTDTLLPGMALGQKKLDTGIVLNLNLTSWTSSGDPAPGQYALGLDVRGDPQIFIWTETQPYWRGGPWNGRWFSGVPEVKDGTDGVIDFYVEKDHTTYLPINRSSTIVRWTMNSSGHLELLVWIEARWSVSWYIPKDHCDRMSQCGNNSYCSSNNSPLCTCLPAFHPRNQHNWDMLDGVDGCIRTTPLDCRNKTGGFFTQSGTKLPDTSRSTVLANLSLEECSALCLSNCSCTAYAALDISGSGSGCLIWTDDLTDITVYQSGLGQDLYVRLAAKDLVSASQALHHHSNRKIIMIVVLPLAILFLACVAYSIWRWKKRSSHIDYEAEEKDMELPLFDLNTIKDATDDFSIDNKLGEGGFGPVYKGKLGEEQEIAVKRLSKTSTQGVDEFKNEITLIAKLQHRNLVKLLGCCIQGGERLLIYEYLSNGSLDTFLFDEVQTVLLDWRARYNIILGVARGLLYLHHDSRLRIIHRDLKASNILLDKDMNPKISDFGMARIFGGDESESTTKRVVGTYGYMSPEYVMDGIFSIKSDVFSFGVLMLEIISGKKNRDSGQSMSQLNLLGNMWIMWKEGKCLDLVDTNFSHSFFENEVLRCIKVGLLCVQEQPGDRPTMSSMLAMLVSTDNISFLPEPKQPGFFSTRLSSINSDYSNTESLSINQASITAIVGR